jgi:protease-4
MTADAASQAHARRLLEDNLLNATRLLINLRRSSQPPAPWVALTLQGHLAERETPQHIIQQRLPFLRVETSIETVSRQLEMLAYDPGVRGAVVRILDLQAGLATLQSLRAYLERFRAEGKSLIAYVPEPTLGRLYVAAAAERVIAPPSAWLPLLGVGAELVFIKDSLAQVGVEADFLTWAEYKTAADQFRHSEMSEAHREMLEALLDSHYNTLVQGIADGRGLSPDKVRSVIDRGLVSAAEALEAGLLDELRYEDELQQAAESGNSRSIEPWPAAGRHLRQPLRWRPPRSIGVISLEGLITTGESRPLPIPGLGPLAGSETLVRAFRRAEEDASVAAIVFHISSGGGSALASDLIWREARRVGRTKPVVAYMGDVAASGGYYVAAGATHIVAQPATLTGSIGVVVGKMVMSGLYGRLSANRQSVRRGALAGLFAEDRTFSAEERERMTSFGQGIYDDFKQRVAEARGMRPEAVERIARGRVWSGHQALEVGLADELGSFQAAEARARQLIGAAPEDYVPVVNIRPARQFSLPSGPPSSEAAIAGLLGGLGSLAREHAWALMPWVVRWRI